MIMAVCKLLSHDDYIVKLFACCSAFQCIMKKTDPLYGLPVERNAVEQGIFQALTTVLSFNDSCPVVGLMGHRTVLHVSL